MLEYTKTILDKVSFDQYLFSKELRKSFKWLQKDEILALYTWCMLMFGEIYGDLIKDTFKVLS
ncbi:MAG: hypothetical protein KKA81_11170 [Bacteroidetes bacterium]|nr:hypothetical protein [Bacteroidota bacterium]